MAKKRSKKWVLPTASIVFILGVLLIATQFAQKPDAFVSGRIIANQEITQRAQGINIMFITLFDANLPGPPFGAMREPINIGSKKSIDRVFYVTREKLMIMRPGAPFPEKLRVKVRFDRDGQGGPDRPGDIVGEVDQIPIGQENLMIEMTKVIE